MDINDLRSFFTVAAFFAFVVILLWAFSGRRKQDFEAAAMLALDDDIPGAASTVSSPNKERN